MLRAAGCGRITYFSYFFSGENFLKKWIKYQILKKYCFHQGKNAIWATASYSLGALELSVSPWGPHQHFRTWFTLLQKDSYMGNSVINVYSTEKSRGIVNKAVISTSTEVGSLIGGPAWLKRNVKGMWKYSSLENISSMKSFQLVRRHSENRHQVHA